MGRPGPGTLCPGRVTWGSLRASCLQMGASRPPRAGEATAGTGDLPAARSGFQVARAEGARSQRGGSCPSFIPAPGGGVPGPADPHAAPRLPLTAGNGRVHLGRAARTQAEPRAGRRLWATGPCWTWRCLWPLGWEEPRQGPLRGFRAGHRSHEHAVGSPGLAFPSQRVRRVSGLQKPVTRQTAGPLLSGARGNPADPVAAPTPRAP